MNYIREARKWIARKAIELIRRRGAEKRKEGAKAEERKYGQRLEEFGRLARLHLPQEHQAINLAREHNATSLKDLEGRISRKIDDITPMSDARESAPNYHVSRELQRLGNALAHIRAAISVAEAKRSELQKAAGLADEKTQADREQRLLELGKLIGQ